MASPGGGLRVGAVDREGDGLAEVLLGGGPNPNPHARVFDGLVEVEGLVPFGAFGGGLHVG